MNVAIDDIIRVLENRLRLVGENNLRLSTGFPNNFTVELHIIHACELMLVHAEQFSVFLLIQHIGIRIDSRIHHLIDGKQCISHFIGRIAEHYNNLLGTHCHALQADGESVSGKNRPYDSDGLSTQLVLYILCNVVHTSIVSLTSGNHRLGNTDYISVQNLEPIGFRCLQNTFHNLLCQIISFPENRTPDSTGNRTYTSFCFHLSLHLFVHRICKPIS